MSPLASHILAAFLTLQPPGLSPLSLVEVSEDAPRACEAVHSPLCAAPWWSKPHQSFVRPETASEGLERYRLIARVMARVANRMTWQDHPRCQALRAVRWAAPESTTECQALQLTRPWRGSRRQLARFLVVVAYRESSFRRDVHSGIGKLAKGDRGLSNCMGQILLRKGRKTKRGYTATQLLGTDEESTERCVETMVDYLSHAHNVSVSPYGPIERGPLAVFMTYGGVRNAKDPRIKARVSTYLKLERVLGPITVLDKS